MSEVLVTTGLNCLYASTGEEVMQIFHDTPSIELVLMDILLPDTSGFLLTRTMKKENPKLVIIAQTAYSSPSDIEESIKAGCSGHISKPINSKKLMDILDEYLVGTKGYIS